MSESDTSNDNEKVRKIINKLYLAEIAFELEDEQLATTLVHDSLCQLADYHSSNEDYIEC